MTIRYFYQIPADYLSVLEDMFNSLNLKFDKNVDFTVVLEEKGKIIGTASRIGNIFKLFMVDPDYWGQNLTSVLITELKKEGMKAGFRNFAILTKPRNYCMFAGVGFYPICQTKDVLFMEDRRNGIGQFIAEIDKPAIFTQHIAAIIMNGDPFTLGHYELISRASTENERVYLFILSEDRGTFSSQDRLDMARDATEGFENVYVYPTDYYMISSATFPDYFLKNKQNHLRINCSLDVQVFADYFVKELGITRRYVGEEPFCEVTSQYNAYLERMLPDKGVELIKIPRKEKNDRPISASEVRQLIQKKEWEEVQKLVPDVVYNKYIRKQ